MVHPRTLIKEGQTIFAPSATVTQPCASLVPLAVRNGPSMAAQRSNATNEPHTLAPRFSRRNKVGTAGRKKKRAPTRSPTLKIILCSLTSSTLRIKPNISGENLANGCVAMVEATSCNWVIGVFGIGYFVQFDETVLDAEL